MQTDIVYIAPPRVSPDDEGYWAFHGTEDLLGPYATPDAAHRDLARLVETGKFPADYRPEEARRLRLTLSGVAVFPEGRPSLGGRAVQVSALFVEPPIFGVTQAGYYVFEDENDVAGPFSTEAEAQAECRRRAAALGLGSVMPLSPKQPSA